VTKPDDAARFLAAEALAAVGRLRQAWRWLADARYPGTPGAYATLERRRTATARAIESREAIRDRAAKQLAIQAGRTPAGHSPGAARIGPLTVRTTVAADLRRLTERLTDTLTQVELPDRWCPWCAGTGVAQQPAGWVWPWPTIPVRCSRCLGYGIACGTCDAIGLCGCDPADVTVAASLDTITQALPAVTDPTVAADAARTVERCDRACRDVLGLGQDRRVLRTPCPACNYRDMYAEVSSPRRVEWSVVCGAPSCTCSGPGCGCGRPVRYRGRRHRWPWTEWHDLAGRLGVPVGELKGWPAHG
jgi:hypothetical protein